jgi:hypothetical protein
MRRFIIAAASIVAAGTGVAHAASEFDGRLREFATAELGAWVADPVLLDAIRAQNSRHAALTQAQIEELDATWQAEVGAPHAPMIGAMLDRAESKHLKGRAQELGGLVTEVFVMDNRGLNVAQSDVTSDFWQGDEAKWTDTYKAGPDAIHVSEVELDESTQTYQSQVSMTVVDPATGAAIGAMTFGIDVAQLP